MTGARSQLLKIIAESFSPHVVRREEVRISPRKHELQADDIKIAPTIRELSLEAGLQRIRLTLRATGEINYAKLKYKYWELNSGELEVELLAESKFVKGDRWLSQGSVFVPTGLWA